MVAQRFLRSVLVGMPQGGSGSGTGHWYMARIGSLGLPDHETSLGGCAFYPNNHYSKYGGMRGRGIVRRYKTELT